MERLQKVLARAGLASRRKSEELILAQRVRVNGQIVDELGTRVDPARDVIEVDDQPIHLEEKRYVILHKPRGYLSDLDSTRGKPLAVDLVSSKERLYTAGRLDAESEGLLLLTNDGALALRITHPRYEHEKEYLALVRGEPTEESIAHLRHGVWYDGQRLHPDSVKLERRLGKTGREQHWNEAQQGECWLRIILHEGKKREIRHLCGAAGFPVKRLIRVRIGPIELGSLRVGQWRALTPAEVRKLEIELRLQVDSIHHRD